MTEETLHELYKKLEQIDGELLKAITDAGHGNILLSSVMFPLHMAKLDIEKAMDAVKFQLNNKESL